MGRRRFDKELREDGLATVATALWAVLLFEKDRAVVDRPQAGGYKENCAVLYRPQAGGYKENCAVLYRPQAGGYRIS